MPIYTGDKMGFGVAPGEGGASGPVIGYSTSFDNISHSKRIEHKWTVPKTARYNFEVWGADGGMGIAANGDNNNGGIPRYGRGGKVEASFLLNAGTEIGLLIGDNGLPAFSYSGSDSGTFMNDGDGGWGGTIAGEDLATGGNSKYNYHRFGGSGSSDNWRGAGGGGGTIVRLFNGTANADYLIVAGGGGGAGARGRDHGNSYNQGGSGGNANNKVLETQWGRRGYRAGDTSWGWPGGNASAGGGGNSSNGGPGGSAYYAGGEGGGGGCGGGGGGATCTYCSGYGGSGGSCGSTGNRGSAGYNNAAAGSAMSKPSTSITLVGQGGSCSTSGKGAGGGGGGGYRGGGAGHWGNGQGHAGAGGGGGGSSYCMGTGNSYDVKGLNGLTSDPRFTSEQKPMRLGNPGGGRVFIWEANKDPLGKERPAEMTADKIQYLCRSQNGGPSNSQRLYYLGSCSSGSESEEDGGGHDHSCYNNMPYQTPVNTCDAVVMEISGSGLWELHSVTIGQGQTYDYPYPWRHQCWVHVIEGTETGGVGIHTEKFDSNNTTGNPAVAGWYAHMRACAKEQNTADGYIELFFEKPAVLNRGQKYTIALDWSCGGTNSNANQGGIACMNNGAVSARDLRGTGKGTCTWTGVTAYNGPHGLGAKNNNNNMETSASQGQMVHFGVRSIEIASGGGGGGGEYSTTDLICDLDATKSSSYGGSGTTWTNIASSGFDFTIDGATYNASEGNGSFYFDGSNDIVYSNGNYDLSSFNYIFVDMAFKADNSTQIHLVFEHSQSWNSNNHGFGFAVHTDGGSAKLNEHHSNHYGGASQNWNYSVGTGWAVYGCQFAKTGSNNRKQYMNGQIVNFNTGNPYSGDGTDFGNYKIYVGSRYGSVAPAKGYIGYVRVYGSSSELSASTILSNYNAIKSRYGLS